MTQKMHPKAVAFGMDSAGGASYVAIGDVVKIKPPPKKRKVAVATSNDSANLYAEKLKGMKDGDQCTLTIRLVGAQYATLDTAFEDDTEVIPAFQVTFPILTGEVTAATLVFSGILEELAISEGEVDGENPFDVDITINVSGKPVWTSST